jgi:hypothetical protein
MVTNTGVAYLSVSWHRDLSEWNVLRISKWHFETTGPLLKLVPEIVAEVRGSQHPLHAAASSNAAQWIALHARLEHLQVQAAQQGEINVGLCVSPSQTGTENHISEPELELFTFTVYTVTIRVPLVCKRCSVNNTGHNAAVNVMSKTWIRKTHLLFVFCMSHALGMSLCAVFKSLIVTSLRQI